MERNQLLERYVSNGAEPEGLSLKALKSKLFSNWYYFASLGFIGMVVAFSYYKITLPYYKISSLILIKDDSKSNDLNNVFRDLNVKNTSPVIQDQVGVLKSYNLNFKTVQYFNWRYSWYKKGWFVKKDLYGSDPFELTQTEDAFQTDYVPLTIEPLSETEYEVSCDEKAKIKGKEEKISFSKKVKFGELFKNEYFQFTLNKKVNEPIKVGETYYLQFNNLNQVALSYKERLQVKPASEVENSNLIVVELVTSHLSRDVDYLNQLGKIFIQFGLDEKNRIANNTIKFIDDQISGVDRSLRIAGDQFSNFRARNRTVDLGQEASTVVEKLQGIEAERADLELKLEYYNNLKFYLENRDQNKDLVAPSLVGVTDDALNSKVLKLNELYTRREVLSYTAQEKNPVIISLNNEINYTQKSLRENVDNLISNTNVEIQNLNARQGSVNSELSRLPKTEQDLIGIKRNFDLNNELYTFLLQRRAEAEILKASNNPDAQILDPTDNGIAVLMGPKLLIDLLVGIFGGVFLAFCIVLVKEIASDVVTDVDEVTKKLDISVVGTIGSNRYKSEMPVVLYPRSSLTESFRGIRLNLEHYFKNSNGKVLAIHSYISGEGKSFVVSNLAAVFAMGNKKVLLVDSDLRKPRLNKIMNIEDDEVGLSTYLEGNCSMDQIIKKTEIENLDFIPAGPVHPNASELLNNGVIKSFIDEVRNYYDYILIDNSPMGVVYDPIIVGVHADFNLVLLRLNYSKSEEIEAINKIGHDGILKRVMVAINGKKSSKGYGYYTDDKEETKETSWKHFEFDKVADTLISTIKRN